MTAPAPVWDPIGGSFALAAKACKDMAAGNHSHIFGIHKCAAATLTRACELARFAFLDRDMFRGVFYKRKRLLFARFCRAVPARH